VRAKKGDSDYITSIRMTENVKNGTKAEFKMELEASPGGKKKDSNMCTSSLK